jgi:large subunit ribosomal protein L17
MRHQKTESKLNRDSAHRRALLRNLATALFEHERIETTHAKARALRPFAERLITMGKRGDLHARRLVARHIQDHAVLKKLFDDLAARFASRDGGYTRILKTGTRKGDNSMQAFIELVDRKAQSSETTPSA